MDEHLADQLLLPAALASEKSEYQVAEISQHLTTNAWVVEKFELAQVSVDKVDKLVIVEPFRKMGRAGEFSEEIAQSATPL